MQKCKVLECPTNKQEKIDRSITFHKIPRDPYFQKIWMENCGREITSQRDNFYVCSLHFDETDYDIDYYNKRKLKIIAVPTKYLPESKDDNEQNVYMSSLEAVDDLPSKTTTLQEHLEECNENVSDMEKQESELEKQYKHLQLEYEILQDHVNDREYTLISLRKENALLNDLLKKMPQKE